MGLQGNHFRKYTPTTSIITILFVVFFRVIYSHAADSSLPKVYTQWQTYYEDAQGLPNDHIFALKSDGDRLWVGTENGLALLENEKWQSWTEKDGLFDTVEVDLINLHNLILGL